MIEISFKSLVDAAETDTEEPDAYVFSSGRRFKNGLGIYGGHNIPTNALKIGGEYLKISNEYVTLTE